MKKLSGTLLFSILFVTATAQSIKKGKIIAQKFLAESLKNNRGGEDPMRSVSVYLPPGYEETNQRYPTIYFLHGVSTSDTEMFTWLGLKELMDKAIASGRIRPMILVVPNSYNLYRGSFYTNSTLIGNWADFIGKDVVVFTDKNFRTIAERRSRGLAGHSMGGNGALKIAMLFPEVFNAVYAMSPAVLNWSNDFTIRNNGFKKISKATNEQEIIKGYDSGEAGFYAGAFTAMGRAYAPDERNTMIKTKLPIDYIGDSAIIDIAVIKKWEASFPINMIEDHLPGLKSFAALKIDWGRNEEFSHIPATALQFSKKLETYKVKHFAEEYIGGHINMLGGYEGRIYTELLPFFDKYLE